MFGIKGVTGVFHKDEQGNYLVDINNSGRRHRITHNAKTKSGEVRHTDIINIRKMRTVGNLVTTEGEFWRGWLVGDILDAIYNIENGGLESGGQEIPHPDETEELKYFFEKIEGLKLFQQEQKQIMGWYYEIMEHVENFELEEENAEESEE